jgi:uncharacterized membrane protein YfcA
MDWLIVPGATAGPAAYIAAGVVAVMLVGISKGGFGSGLGMLSVPVMMLVAPGTSVLPLMLPVLIACDILAIREYPKNYCRRAIVRVAPGAFSGLLIGWGLLWWLSHNQELRVRNDALLRLGVGGLCVVFVALWGASQWLRRHEGEKPPWQPTWLGGTLAGVPSGVTTMLAHAAGPVFTMYLLPQKLDRRDFVGTTVRYFFVFNLLKIPLFLTIPGEARLNLGIFKSELWMLALAPLGVWIGRWLNDRLSQKWFNYLLYFFLTLAGIQLIWNGAGTLWPR